MKRQSHNHPPFRPTCAEHPVGACLVVIDPEDTTQVCRLVDLLLAHGYDFSGRQTADLAAALRAFASPPKPAEPTGLGAVVEDVTGTRWTRVETGDGPTRNPWYPAADGDQQPEEWADIAAVEVLSKGVPA